MAAGMFVGIVVFEVAQRRNVAGSQIGRCPSWNSGRVVSATGSRARARARADRKRSVFQFVPRATFGTRARRCRLVGRTIRAQLIA